MAYTNERKKKDDPVRAFLGSAMEARMEARRHERRVEALNSRCARLTAQFSAAPGGGGDLEQTWAALADEKSREEEATRQELAKYREVEQFIGRVPNAIHRSILRLRYLDGLKWTQVCQRLRRDGGVYYSERHVARLHGEALESAREVWRKEAADGVPPQEAPDLLH